MYGSGTAIGGNCYDLWFVDRRYKNIEQYPLNSLASYDILKALRLFFRDMGGRYPDKMIWDRDFKLIRGQVSAALENINEDREENNQSVVTGAPAGRKNQNDLPEIKLRHAMNMDHNCLTSKYLPRKFWYFALKMTAQVSNYMPILLENGQWNTFHEKNMVSNLNGATFCLCSPLVTSVETGTATNSGPLSSVNPSWGSALATIPKVMQSCSTSQPQKK